MESLDQLALYVTYFIAAAFFLGAIVSRDAGMAAPLVILAVVTSAVGLHHQTTSRSPASAESIQAVYEETKGTSVHEEVRARVVDDIETITLAETRWWLVRAKNERHDAKVDLTKDDLVKRAKASMVSSTAMDRQSEAPNPVRR